MNRAVSSPIDVLLTRPHLPPPYLSLSSPPSGLRHGHYVCLVKVSHQWFCYDDDDIHLWTVEDVKTVFGSAYTGEKNGYLDGYLLFYTQVGIDDERS